MQNFFLTIAKSFWPELESMNEQRRLVGAGDVIVSLVTIPLAIVGLAWLIYITDLQVLIRDWGILLLCGVLIILFSKVNYFIIVEIRTDRYGSADGSLAVMIQWVAVFLFGPTALWLSILWSAFNFAGNWRRSYTKSGRWSLMRTFSQDVTSTTLAFLIALLFYRQLGGEFPIPGLKAEIILPAMGALFVYFIILILIWIVYISYGVWIQKLLDFPSAIDPLIKFFFLALGLPVLADPFAILAAGLYAEDGIFVFLFFMAGLLLVAYLARQLSWAAESSRQQSRQLEQLEHLGRDIINSPPDASALPSLMEQHVPAMFPSARVAICLSPDQILIKNPGDWPINLDPIREWVNAQPEIKAFLAKDRLPWGTQAGGHDPVVIAPIFEVESIIPIGCIYIELRSLSQPWDVRALNSLFPAVQSLAAQVASALHQADVYEEALAYQQASQELAFAGRIQASFLPSEMPRLTGWELAVTLLPARETSGDYFDFIPLADDKIGILIADVADKGLGAALYMALSRTLIRTYALEYVDAQPDIVFFSTNERILKDARANLFVTAFYGILDQKTGTLTYCNAGHNPPYLFSPSQGGKVTPLSPTGMPIGVEEDEIWKQVTLEISQGDVLIFYTDGIPDSQNTEGEFFKEERLVDLVKNHLEQSAQEIQTAILDEIQKFVGPAPQFDDITLLVMIRNQ